jgi:hypothetical protein
MWTLSIDPQYVVIVVSVAKGILENKFGLAYPSRALNKHDSTSIMAVTNGTQLLQVFQLLLATSKKGVVSEFRRWGGYWRRQ